MHELSGEKWALDTTSSTYSNVIVKACREAGFAECGDDRSSWPSAKHFTSWLGPAPNNKVSGGKMLSSRTRRSGGRAAALLRLAAVTVGRTDTALGAFYRRLSARIGKAKAVTATARKIAILLYNAVRYGMDYVDPVAASCETRYRTRVALMPTDSIENEEIDRSPPIAVFLSGESFFKSAEYLRGGIDAEEVRLRFNMPIYNLYSHAMELVLKAYLRSKGVTSNRLRSRDYGHKLRVLWEACLAESLPHHPINDVFVAQMIEILDPFAADFEFRYIQVGFKSLPTLGAVQAAVGDLMATVRPFCEATVDGPLPD